MAETKKLVVMITRGFDDERSSVAWSVISGGINSGLEVTVFLTSSGVDWVRKGAAVLAHLNPLDPPMKEMIDKLIDSGGKVLVCPPCAKVRATSRSTCSTVWSSPDPAPCTNSSSKGRRL